MMCASFVRISTPGGQARADELDHDERHSRKTPWKI